MDDGYEFFRFFFFQFQQGCQLSRIWSENFMLCLTNHANILQKHENPAGFL